MSVERELRDPKRSSLTTNGSSDFTDAHTEVEGSFVDANASQVTIQREEPIETLATEHVAQPVVAEDAPDMAALQVPGVALGGATQLETSPDTRSSIEKRDSSSDTKVDVEETAALEKLPPGWKEAIMRQVEVDPPRQIGYFELFRFATRWELFLNAIGILAAIIAGAAQPTMALLFGRLSQQFVTYYSDLYAGRDTTQAANDLFSQVALLSGILAGIGGAIALCTWAYSGFWVYNGERITRRIRERYLRSVLRQNIAYHDTVRSRVEAGLTHTDRCR